MAFKYVKIDEEQLKAFDPEGKLEIYEPEDTEGLKNKANELLGELREAKTKVKTLESDLAQSKLDRTGGDTDLDKLRAQLEDSESRRQEAETRVNELKDGIRTKEISGEANRIAAMLTTDTRRAALLAEKVSSRLDLDDDGKFRVLSNDGKPTVSSVDELASSIRTEYDFLVDGSKASGGSAQGGEGGAGSSNTMTRSEWQNMPPIKQSEFIAKGGALEDG